MSNKETAARGASLLDSYIAANGVADDEKEESYVITDAICALLHHAHSRGLKYETLAHSAIDHVNAETVKCDECGNEHNPDLECE